MLASKLIALAMTVCQWVPQELPPLHVLHDAVYEMAAQAAGVPRDSRAFVTYGTPHRVYVRRSVADERLVCHEWRHIVEPEWDHE